MARQMRVEHDGAIGHLIHRGDRRGDLFRDDADRRRFLETVEKACGKTAWEVHTSGRMRNHCHFVVETPRANLCRGMDWRLGTDTARFHRRHRVVGHLCRGRDKSFLVDRAGKGGVKTVCDDAPLNPARGRWLAPEQRLRDDRWSSSPE